MSSSLLSSHSLFRRGLVLALAVGGLVLASSAPALAEDLEGVLTRAMQGGSVPAMGILVIREGKVAGQAVQGRRRIDGAVAVSTDDVWHIGSDGKAITATLIARLVDKGVLSWTTPLEKMLPDLAGAMQPQYRSATLAQMLSHHTGLPHDLVDEKVLAVMMAEAGNRPLSARRVNYITKALADAPVGPVTDFNYSNTGYVVAAVIAERVTGKSFESLLQQEVLQPLGMTDTHFGLTHAGQNQGHTKGKVATPADGNPDFFAPVGNMYMPLSDWALFCIDQMEGDAGHGKLLKADTYRLMHTPQPGGSAGFGWGVQDKLAGRQGPVLAHAGSDGTWYALVALFPKSRSGVLVTANAGEDMEADKADKAALMAVVESLSPPAK